MGTRYLKKDEKLLYRQSINAPKGFPTEGISELYVQKPNRKFLGLPINVLVWMYYTGEAHYHPEKFVAKRDRIEKKFSAKIDSTTSRKRKTNLQYRKQKKIDGLNVKIESGNMFMQWGEKVSVFDSANVAGTTQRLDGYLFTKGYFLGKASYTTSESNKKVTVKYFIDPGPRYFYDSISYDIADTAIETIMEKNKARNLLRKGDPFDQEKLNSERERIDLLLKDNGYFDFSRQYVDFDIDSSYKPGYKIALRVEIKNPARRLFHKKFVVDSVSFTTDASTQPPKKNARRQTSVYREITFNYYTDLYSKKILSQRVFIKKDSLYNRTAAFETQQKLTSLDVFKFANINYDTSGGHFVANIFTSPLDRYSWSNEAGFTVTQGFPGPYYNMSLRKRNIFRGLESFDINGRFGFEGVASPTHIGNFYKSTEASLNGTLTFPQFLIPLSSNAGFKYGKFNPRTKIVAGYTYTDRPPDYTRAITNVSAQYNWETNKRRLQYSFTPISLSVIRSKTDSAFNALLETLKSQGNNLINSFKPSFVSSMIFSVIWNPNNYGNTKTSAFFLRAQVEAGGTLFNFYTPTFATNRGLETYKFVRLNFEIKKTMVMDRNTVLAYHFNSGMAYSYGNGRSLPYEKYFFAGGSNGVRAWRPRRLGIGSYPVKLSSNPAKDGLFDYSYEKPGEILLEGSIEVRKKLFGFFSGALFIDAGNVWTFKQVAPQTGSDYPTWTGNTQFRIDQFYKEFGIGTGFGLRFDFTFLVLRLDVGVKAYDPARAVGDRFILTKAKFWSPYAQVGEGGKADPNSLRDPVIYNVGIGFPF